jgi:hypothetical protein
MATGARASGHVWNDRYRTNVNLDVEIDHDLDHDADSDADAGSKADAGAKAEDDGDAVETPWGCG